MDKKYTTGRPWTSRGTLGPRRAEHLLGPCVIEDSNGKQIAVLSGWRDKKQESDGRLMAAAPDLLDALEELVDLYMSMNNPTGPIISKAMLAIERAKGING